jgi:hypothetical protein
MAAKLQHLPGCTLDMRVKSVSGGQHEHESDIIASCETTRA